MLNALFCRHLGLKQLFLNSRKLSLNSGELYHSLHVAAECRKRDILTKFEALLEYLC